MWVPNENETEIFIVSEFAIPRDFEDMSPAVIVTRSSVVHNRDVVADSDQENLELVAKGAQYHWATGEVDLRLECVGQTRGEATTIGDIVATTVHMTRDPICKAFALRDISPVMQQPTVEYERDQQKWVSIVEFRIFFEQRWFVLPEAPTVNKIDFDASGTTAELPAPDAPTLEEVQQILADNPITAPTTLTLGPGSTVGVQDLVFLHSPINLLNQFVALFRTRFVTGQLPWTYRENAGETQIFIESEFSIPRDIEDASPAIIVSRGSIVHKRDVISDTDQNNYDLIAKGGEYEWSTGECDIRIQVIGQTKAEAALLGDIVQTTVHMTRDPICQAFTLRDVSPVVMSQVVEYERDQRKWAATVDFRVFFEHRWFSIPEAPVLRKILFEGFPILEPPVEPDPDPGPGPGPGPGPDPGLGDARAIDEFTAPVGGTSFVLSHIPIPVTLTVYYNGMRLARGTSLDYTLTGATITTVCPLRAGDRVSAEYNYDSP